MILNISFMLNLLRRLTDSHSSDRHVFAKCCSSVVNFQPCLFVFFFLNIFKTGIIKIFFFPPEYIKAIVNRNSEPETLDEERQL